MYTKSLAYRIRIEIRLPLNELMDRQPDRVCRANLQPVALLEVVPATAPAAVDVVPEPSRSAAADDEEDDLLAPAIAHPAECRSHRFGTTRICRQL